MSYKIELHAHTSESSGCGRLPGMQMAQAYALKGYKTLVVTDHIWADRFQSGFRRAEDRAELYLAGYRAAKAEGEKWGIHVLPGAEARLVTGSEDYLVLGLHEDHIAPLILTLDSKPTLVELRAAVNSYGAYLIQAHPFRDGHRAALKGEVDGFEVYNGSQGHNSHNDRALMHANRYPCIMTSGSDAHQIIDVGRGGVLSEEEIASPEDLVRLLTDHPHPIRLQTNRRNKYIFGAGI